MNTQHDKCEFTEALKRVEDKLDKALSLLLQPKADTDKHGLNTQEAMRFTSCKSRYALARWINTWAPFARVSKNRYYTARLKIGKARELSAAPRETAEEARK